MVYCRLHVAHFRTRTLLILYLLVIEQGLRRGRHILAAAAVIIYCIESAVVILTHEIVQDGEERREHIINHRENSLGVAPIYTTPRGKASRHEARTVRRP